MKPIYDIRPQAPVRKKAQSKVVTPQPLDKQAFTRTIDQLSNRLNYTKEEVSRRARFLRAIKTIKK